MTHEDIHRFIFNNICTFIAMVYMSRDIGYAWSVVVVMLVSTMLYREQNSSVVVRA